MRAESSRRQQKNLFVGVVEGKGIETPWTGADTAEIIHSEKISRKHTRRMGGTLIKQYELLDLSGDTKIE